jgi:hypothetical protein
VTHRGCEVLDRRQADVGRLSTKSIGKPTFKSVQNTAKTGVCKFAFSFGSSSTVPLGLTYKGLPVLARLTQGTGDSLKLQIKFPIRAVLFLRVCPGFQR